MKKTQTHGQFYFHVGAKPVRSIMRKFGLGKIASIIAVFCVATAVASSAQTFTSVASFDGTDGSDVSYGPLVQGTNGDLYGAAMMGGVSSNCPIHYGCGAIFSVTQAGKLSVLYNFCTETNCADGASPQAGLILAADGNFYGTTRGGGTKSRGVVYKITPSGTYTRLYSFCSQSSCADGFSASRLIQASNENFYGVNAEGGAKRGGTVFEITPAGVLTTLHTFCSSIDGNGNCLDGQYAEGGLVQASDGNLYGVTFFGGGGGVGNVFQITTAGALTSIYSFCTPSGGNCLDGVFPEASLIQASNGNLYGATYGGGSHGAGTAFEVTTAGALTTLHSFCADFNSVCLDGSNPIARLTQASDGNIYGTTWGGGPNNDGTIFQLTLAGAFTQIYSLCSQTNCTDGIVPNAGLMQAANAKLYGATSFGGADYRGCLRGGGCGSIYSLSLAPESQAGRW
jgi:uncharacterized repeat protein (TIGR03803 family)